jgi:hypothetical protein
MWIRERVRRAHYARREYIHELIAEPCVLLMREGRRALRTTTMATNLQLDSSCGEFVAQRGFALTLGETAEQFLAERDQLVKSVGIEPKWRGTEGIMRKLEAGDFGG